MPNTYVALATQTVTSSTGITFSSIPSGYTDLVIVCNGVDSGGGYIRVRLNGDTGTNYSRTILRGNGTSAISARSSNDTAIFFDFITTNATVIANVMNYSNTTTFKPVLHRSNNSTDNVTANANLYRSTSAITTISLAAGDGGSTLTGTFSLYGIANADQGAAKATGGIITEDANYWYHTFGASGAFIPKQSLTCEVLAIGGGGGGASAWNNTFAGGGNSGTLTYNSSVSVTATSYPISIGGGGTGGADASGNTGGTGTSSTFNTTTVVGGGGTGGSQNNSVLPNGGSGAGVAATNSNGANGSTTYSSWGVVTGVGQNVSNTYYFAGGGGSGLSSSQSGTAGTGGFGGGGAGVKGSPYTATTGRANTGGGGGGSGGGGAPGSAGGSGLVIVRYAK